jgi:UDP-glucose 4-epimerase
MINCFKYGASYKFVKIQLFLSWSIIKYGKKLSNVPVLKWIINPFFKRPHNELTAIPIHKKVTDPTYSAVPLEIMEKLIARMDEIFIMNECHCAGLKNKNSPRLSIGCLALGPAIKRIHPSHGKRVGSKEAIAHVRNASAHGLVANIAHVWIDAFAFQLTDFNKLLFICFCDDDQCIYRTHMKKRGPNLEKTYKKLPGIQIVNDLQLCTGCGECRDKCFVSAIDLVDDKAVIGESCVGCGVCIQSCKNAALGLSLDNEEKLLEQLLNRVREMSGVLDTCGSPKRNPRENAC